MLSDTILRGLPFGEFMGDWETQEVMRGEERTKSSVVAGRLRGER